MTSDRTGVLVMVNTLDVGGAEKHAISLAHHLDPARFRTSVCSLKPLGSLARDLDPARQESLLSLDVRKKLDWDAVSRLTRHIESHRIDIIICTNEYPVLYALVAARLAQRPVRLVEVFHTTGFRRPFVSHLRMLFSAFVFRQCALVVYVSYKQRDYWRARLVSTKRDIVIHNGIDTSYFVDQYSAEQKAAIRAQYGYAPGDYVIGICAALRPEKQHGDLLLAMQRLQSAGVRAKLLIIGDGPRRPVIERQIAELGLSSCVAIAGYQADVRPYVASCDVMVLTSHVVETFSIAALEAMSLGKPMVMSRIGGAEEQIVHGTHGLLFEPGDIATLARHLQALDDPERRSRMGAAAAKTVRERFTIQRMAAHFTEELQKLTDAQLRLPSTVAS